jgi:hypothetical protein
LTHSRAPRSRSRLCSRDVHIRRAAGAAGALEALVAALCVAARAGAPAAARVAAAGGIELALRAPAVARVRCC